jgi:hypothetical protein
MIPLKPIQSSYTAMNFRREQPSTMVQAVAYRVKLGSDRACERSEADTHRTAAEQAAF